MDTKNGTTRKTMVGYLNGVVIGKLKAENKQLNKEKEKLVKRKAKAVKKTAEYKKYVKLVKETKAIKKTIVRKYKLAKVVLCCPIDNQLKDIATLITLTDAEVDKLPASKRIEKIYKKYREVGTAVVFDGMKEIVSEVNELNNM